MKYIPQSHIPDLIEKITRRGARPFSVALLTEPKLKKRGRASGVACPFKSIQKLQMVNCFLNVNYEKAVNRQRDREGEKPDFKVQPNWFTHTKTKGIVMHLQTLRLYLQLKVERVLESYFFDGETEIDFNALEEYLPLKHFPVNQGVEKPILSMTPALDSIVAFRADGEIYSVAFIPELVTTKIERETTWKQLK